MYARGNHLCARPFRTFGAGRPASGGRGSHYKPCMLPVYKLLRLPSPVRCMHIAPLGRPLSPLSLALGMSCHWLPGPVAFQPVNALSKVLPFDLVQSRSCPRTFHRLFNGPLHGTYNAILVCFKRPYICTVDAKRATSHYVILFAVGTVT